MYQDLPVLLQFANLLLRNDYSVVNDDVNVSNHLKNLIYAPIMPQTRERIIHWHSGFSVRLQKHAQNRHFTNLLAQTCTNPEKEVCLSWKISFRNIEPKNVLTAPIQFWADFEGYTLYTAFCEFHFHTQRSLKTSFSKTELTISLRITPLERILIKL